MAKVTRRCGCRDDDGRQYGANCPRLKDWRHGTWGFRISAGRDPKTGRRRYLSEAGHRTADDAKEALADAQRALRRGTADFTRTRVGDYLQTWLDQQEGQLKPSTHGNYSRYLTADVIPALGGKLLKDLQRADVAALVRRLQDDGRGADSGPPDPRGAVLRARGCCAGRAARRERREGRTTTAGRPAAGRGVDTGPGREVPGGRRRAPPRAAVRTGDPHRDEARRTRRAPLVRRRPPHPNHHRLDAARHDVLRRRRGDREDGRGPGPPGCRCQSEPCPS